MRLHRGMKTIGRSCLFLAVPFVMHLLTTPTRGSDKAESQVLVFVGTYTITKSKGIYAYRFDAATGRLTSVGLVANTTNPSFLAVHPSRRFLYAVNEIANYESGKSGGVSSFAIDRETGKLTLVTEVSSHGADPCHVSLDKAGKFVLVANYSGGSIAVFPVLEDGRLGEASAFVQHTGSSVNPKRQEGPHAHSIDTSSATRFLLAADLGRDRLLVYRFDPFRGSLEPNDPAFAKINPGAGPRHFAFHPSGRFVYAVNEMGSSISAFSYDAARGSLRELQTISTLPKDFASQSDAAEIEVHPGGKFLYGSNRGHDSIAVFAIEAGKGTLTPVGDVPTQGKTPRKFAIYPTRSHQGLGHPEPPQPFLFPVYTPNRPFYAQRPRSPARYR